MQFFKYNTSTALERPSLQSWLVIFVCGFLTVCIIGPVLCLAVWLFAMALKWLQMTTFAMWDVSVLAAVRIILQIAAAFGGLLATVMMLELARRKRQERRIPGKHPILGEYEHSPFYRTWHAQPVLPNGKAVRLSAYGSGPTAAQAALWGRFIAQFDELMAAARDSLLQEPHPLQGCESVTLTPCGITLTRDGRLHLGFEFTTVPEDFWTSEADATYPTASFTPELKLKSTEWLKPYG